MLWMQFRRHGLKSEDLAPCKALYNFTKLESTDRISDRLFCSTLAQKRVAVKITRFAHEIGNLRRELETYETLQNRGFKDMPEVYGYVYEESHDRVVGSVMERLHGRYAGSEDLEDCREVLNRVTSCGYIFDDPNRYNWIRTADGMKVFDFEPSCLWEESSTSPADELAALPQHLADTSGVGYR